MQTFNSKSLNKKNFVITSSRGLFNKRRVVRVFSTSSCLNNQYTTIIMATLAFNSYAILTRAFCAVVVMGLFLVGFTDIPGFALIEIEGGAS